MSGAIITVLAKGKTPLFQVVTGGIALQSPATCWSEEEIPAKNNIPTFKMWTTWKTTHFQTLPAIKFSQKSE